MGKFSEPSLTERVLFPYTNVTSALSNKKGSGGQTDELLGPRSAEVATGKASSFVTPEATVRYDPATNSFTYEESEAAKQLRAQREARRQEIYANLNVIGPERTAELEQFKQSFYDELIRLTVDPQERADIQAGRAGTPAIERSARLRTEAGTQAIFAKEQLAQTELQNRVQTLGLLEDIGMNQQQLEQSALGLSTSEALNQRALQEARRSALLQADLTRGQLSASKKEGFMNQAGSVAGQIGSIALLKAISATCLHQDTLIATEQGPVRIGQIKVGQEVLSREGGISVLVPVLKVFETVLSEYPMPVVLVEFTDGSVLVGSHKHPLADGRVLGELAIGDMVESQKVADCRISSARVCVMHDILPDSETGEYLANGLWVKSMLKEVLCHG